MLMLQETFLPWAAALGASRCSLATEGSHWQHLISCVSFLRGPQAPWGCTGGHWHWEADGVSLGKVLLPKTPQSGEGMEDVLLPLDYKGLSGGMQDTGDGCHCGYRL